MEALVVSFDIPYLKEIAHKLTVTLFLNNNFDRNTLFKNINNGKLKILLRKKSFFQNF